MKVLEPMLIKRAGLASGLSYDVEPIDFNMGYMEGILIYANQFLITDQTVSYVLGIIMRPEYVWTAADDLFASDDALFIGRFQTLLTTSGSEQFVSPPMLIQSLAEPVLVACNMAFAHRSSGVAAAYYGIYYKKVMLTPEEIGGITIRRRA